MLLGIWWLFDVFNSSMINLLFLLFATFMDAATRLGTASFFYRRVNDGVQFVLRTDGQGAS
jgi:hypothetical protein